MAARLGKRKKDFIKISSEFYFDIIASKISVN